MRKKVIPTITLLIILLLSACHPPGAPSVTAENLEQNNLTIEKEIFSKAVSETDNKANDSKPRYNINFRVNLPIDFPGKPEDYFIVKPGLNDLEQGTLVAIAAKYIPGYKVSLWNATGTVLDKRSQKSHKVSLMMDSNIKLTATIVKVKNITLNFKQRFPVINEKGITPEDISDIDKIAGADTIKWEIESLKYGITFPLTENIKLNIADGDYMLHHKALLENIGLYSIESNQRIFYRITGGESVMHKILTPEKTNLEFPVGIKLKLNEAKNKLTVTTHLELIED